MDILRLTLYPFDVLIYRDLVALCYLGVSSDVCFLERDVLRRGTGRDVFCRAPERYLRGLYDIRRARVRLYSNTQIPGEFDNSWMRLNAIRGGLGMWGFEGFGWCEGKV